MEKVFISGRYVGELKLSKELLKVLPKQVILALPVQFLEFKESIKKQLEAVGRKVTYFQSKHGKFPGQILGCDVHEFKAEGEFLYVGDGRFHPTALLYANKRKVYCFDPFNQRVEVLLPELLTKLQQKKQGLIAKFLSSERIGLLMTTKPGQNQTAAAERLRERLEDAGKEVFVFLCDEIKPAELVNFNFIEVWVNTACPRLAEDFNCLNLIDVETSY